MTNKEIENYIVSLSKKLKNGESLDLKKSNSEEIEKEFQREIASSLAHMQRMEEQLDRESAA